MFTSNESPCAQDFENNSRLVSGRLEFFVERFKITHMHLVRARNPEKGEIIGYSWGRTRVDRI